MLPLEIQIGFTMTAIGPEGDGRLRRSEGLDWVMGVSWLRGPQWVGKRSVRIVELHWRVNTRRKLTRYQAAQRIDSSTYSGNMTKPGSAPIMTLCRCKFASRVKCLQAFTHGVNFRCNFTYGETVNGKLVHISSLIGFLPRYLSFVLGQCVGDGEPGRFRADEHMVRR
jgi:hypothetical protein